MTTLLKLQATGIARCGSPASGFRYRHAATTDWLDDAEVLARIDALKIPPAWSEVWIAPRPGSRIQAVGTDSTGRLQYLYHPRFRERQERAKHERVVTFAQRLPSIRQTTHQHLLQRSLSRTRVMATMLRLVNCLFLRVGGERYAREHNTYGICTLRKKHLVLSGSRITFRYRGKWGKDQEHSLCDARLARVVKMCAELPGHEIFKYYDDCGQLRDVTSRDFNGYIKELVGSDYSAKDFRTWAGTLIAAWKLGCIGPAEGEREAQRNVMHAIDTVAERLGNTRAVARSSYVDPRIIECYFHGQLIRARTDDIHCLLAPRNAALSHEEREVLKLLQ
jgi:DNA topoisomerase I